MKKIKKKLTAKWEVISMAEWLEELGREPTHAELCEVYEGDFFPMYLSQQVSKNQVWHLKINTKAEHSDGTICNHEIEFKFDKPMSMFEVLNGAKHIKIEQDGFTRRWQGVTKSWLRDLDDDLGNEWIATEALVTATCIAEMTARNMMADKFARLVCGLKNA